MARILVVCVALLLVACSPGEDPPVPVMEASAESATQADQAPPAATPPRSRRTVTIAADPWCPHNCLAGDDHEGYMIDITREALAQSDIDVEYVNMSWARALQLAREGHMDAVVGALPGDAPDFVFPDAAIGHTTIALYTHPDSDWQFSGIDSLNGVTLLAINGYAYSPELDAYIAEHQNNPDRVWILSGPAPLGRAVELLHKRRSDVFPEDRYVMAWEMAQGADVQDLRLASILHESPLYVAFSPALDQSRDLADRLSEGARRLMDSGRIDQILARYGLSLAD